MLPRNDRRIVASVAREWRVCLQADPSGRRLRYRFIAGKRADAERFLAFYLRERDAGRVPASGDVVAQCELQKIAHLQAKAEKLRAALRRRVAAGAPVEPGPLSLVNSQ